MEDIKAMEKAIIYPEDIEYTMKTDPMYILEEKVSTITTFNLSLGAATDDTVINHTPSI